MMKSTKKCPLFSTISLAADGDEVAIEKILNHYDAYISKASLRPFYDEHGNMYIVVDMELKGRIRAALIKAILGFEVRVKYENIYGVFYHLIPAPFYKCSLKNE